MKSVSNLITVKETASYLKLHPLTVYEYIHSGKLRAIKFGRYYRIDKVDLDRFINRHKTCLEML
jgi:excisionase family DNA binding protein